jgi:NADH-quinone oxidoreductase subunit L
VTRAIEIFLLGLALGLPFVAVLLQGLFMWLDREPNESLIHRLVSSTFGLVFVANVALGLVLVLSGQHHLELPLPTWFHVGHYEFVPELFADRLSVPFATFSSALLAVVASFSRRYLHRESGYARFYLLLTLFGASVGLLLFSGSLDFAFFSWEIVGLTSTLLIAFFHERGAPVRHALRAFITYRVCDVGLLCAGVWFHHTAHSTSHVATSVAPWGGFPAPELGRDAVILSLLLLFASLGKAAQFPLGGWLPRAMEGPTPSSAIFYGALSVHLGPYLLLRSVALFDGHPGVRLVVGLVGLLTAVHATFVGRVQTDIKSALAYAAMGQVGLIYLEIAAGAYVLALLHIVGHATLRCLQILRSPSVLHDFFEHERALGGALPRLGTHLDRLFPKSVQMWLYRASLERGYLDSLLLDYVVFPTLRLARALDGLDEAWCAFLLKRGERDPEAKSQVSS